MVMSKSEMKILQNIAIIKLILDDCSEKTANEDFFINEAIETIDKVVRDLEYVFSGGRS